MTFVNWSEFRVTLRTMAISLAGSLLLIFPAIINGYPLIYSDTSTYLASGFTWQPPFDRPMAYGVFIRLASLNGLTLWTVLLFQAMLLSLLLYKLSFRIPGVRTDRKPLAYILVLIAASLSGAAWTTSYLLPDVFTAIMVLSLLLIVLGEGPGRKHTGFYILYGFALSTHSSHLVLSIALIALLILIWLMSRKEERSRFRIRQIALFIGITVFGYLSMASSLSKSRHVFLMGAYVEQGIIGAYLEDNCGEESYSLCAYKDSLPAHAWEFMWEPSSPLYRLGGWKATKDEFSEIIRNTYLSPKYFWMHIRSSARQTAQQLIRFRSVDVYGVAPNNEQLRERITQYVPGDTHRFDSAIQNRTNLRVFAWMNPLQLALVLTSLLLILVWIPRPFRGNSAFMTGTLMVIIYSILIHAFICGTFANAIDRLGNKMIWFLPVLAVLLMIDRQSKIGQSEP